VADRQILTVEQRNLQMRALFNGVPEVKSTRSDERGPDAFPASQTFISLLDIVGDILCLHLAHRIDKLLLF
jgi:hypothetical protein